MSYTITHNDKQFQFQSEKETFIFHYTHDEHFLFITQCSILHQQHPNRINVNAYLKLHPEKTTDFIFFFKTIFNHAKESGFLAVFTDLINRFSIHKLHSTLNIHRLKSEESALLNKLTPSTFFNSLDSYHYHEFEPKFILRMCISYIRITNAFISLSRDVDCFDFNSRASTFFYEGETIPLQFNITKEGLYFISPAYNFSEKIESDASAMQEKLLPLLDKIKTNKRLSFLFNQEFYFAKKFFQGNYPLLISNKLYMKVVESLLPYHSKQQLEREFWRKIHYKSSQIKKIPSSHPFYTFQLFDFHFKVDVREKTIVKEIV